MSAAISSIGQVLAELQPEFPDLTVSKIRFLEAEGLVVPARAPSGYRRYTPADVDRLMYVLRAQRDHFLPLKVIAEHLDAMDRGLVPPEHGDIAPRAPQALAGAEPGPKGEQAPTVWLTADEMQDATGLDADQLAELQSGSLVCVDQETGMYDADALAAAQAAAALAQVGLSARHLRSVRLAADRHLGIIESVVSARPHQPDGSGSGDLASALADQLAVLQQAIVRTALRQGPNPDPDQAG